MMKFTVDGIKGWNGLEIGHEDVDPVDKPICISVVDLPEKDNQEIWLDGDMLPELIEKLQAMERWLEIIKRTK